MGGSFCAGEVAVVAVDFGALNAFLGIHESYQLPDALMTALLDKSRRAELLGMVAGGIDGATDPLRDYFQENHSNRDAMMQDYTPDCLCELVARLAPPAPRMLDLCAGTGALTLFTAKTGTEVRCEELSERVLPVLLMNLALRNIGGVVVRRDVCADEEFGAYRLTPGERFSGIEPCDPPEARPVPLCVSNPPYSLKWSGADSSLRMFGWDLPPKSKADYLFVLDALVRLDDDGTAIFILPHGVLFRGASEGKIRRELVERDLIDAVIGLPNNMFMNTGIPVCVVVFKRHKTRDGVLFVDASKGFEKLGKLNAMRDEDIARIVEAYESRHDADRFAHVATLDEIRDNDYNLNIPRYVDTFEYVEPPNLIDCMNDLMQTDADIRAKEREIAESLSKLVGTAHGVDYQRDTRRFIEYLRGGAA